MYNQVFGLLVLGLAGVTNAKLTEPQAEALSKGGGMVLMNTDVQGERLVYEVIIGSFEKVENEGTPDDPYTGAGGAGSCAQFGGNGQCQYGGVLRKTLSKRDRPLPPGWEKLVDPSSQLGIPYYVDSSGKSHRALPKPVLTIHNGIDPEFPAEIEQLSLLPVGYRVLARRPQSGEPGVWDRAEIHMVGAGLYGYRVIFDGDEDKDCKRKFEDVIDEALSRASRKAHPEIYETPRSPSSQEVKDEESNRRIANLIARSEPVAAVTKPSQAQREPLKPGAADAGSASPASARWQDILGDEEKISQIADVRESTW